MPYNDETQFKLGVSNGTGISIELRDLVGEAKICVIVEPHPNADGGVWSSLPYTGVVHVGQELEFYYVGAWIEMETYCIVMDSAAP